MVNNINSIEPKFFDGLYCTKHRNCPVGVEKDALGLYCPPYMKIDGYDVPVEFAIKLTDDFKPYSLEVNVKDWNNDKTKDYTISAGLEGVCKCSPPDRNTGALHIKFNSGGQFYVPVRLLSFKCPTINRIDRLNDFLYERCHTTIGDVLNLQKKGRNAVLEILREWI